MKQPLAVATILATILVAQSAVAATASLSRDFRFAAARPAGLEVDNLAGDVRIEPATGAGFEVDVEVTVEADRQADADALVRAVEFRQQDAGNSSSLQVVLSTDDFPQIYRRGAPRGWLGGRMYVDYLGERRRITGDAGQGVRLRVNLVIRAPADSRLVVRNVLGDVLADRFTGELTLDGTAGRMRASNGSGKVTLDTGSGPVEVSRHTGAVIADTGSGTVTIEDCECEIGADTGSGAIKVRGGLGSLGADTGSGGVSVHDFAGSIVADTGSGAVRVQGDLSRLERLVVDTGSGGVTLEAGDWPQMEIVVDTASGRIDIDVPGAAVTRDSGRHTVVRIGDGSRRGVINTGSGSVSLRTRPAPVAD